MTSFQVLHPPLVFALIDKLGSLWILFGLTF
jgi:hypothetical protein